MAESRTEVEAIRVQIEEMWAHQDILFDHLNAHGGWDSPHGTDWTFADVPFHLAYCNRELIIDGLTADPDDLPPLLDTPEVINAWNDAHFAARPADHTVAESLAALFDTRDGIRALLDEMSDADLDAPAWFPIVEGWTITRRPLKFCLDHDWSEFTQLRVHMGLDGPIPSSAIARGYLEMAIGLYAMIVNPAVAMGQDFGVVWAFTDPGIGAFTLRVANDAVSLAAGAMPDAHLTFTLSAETFERMLRGINPMDDLIDMERLLVSDWAALSTFKAIYMGG